MKRYLLLLLMVCLGCCVCSPVYAAVNEESVQSDYQEYMNRFRKIQTRQEIEENGFQIVEHQEFPVEIKGTGEVMLIPAFHEKYRRLALFFADESGDIIFRTEQLQTNLQHMGRLEQPNKRLAAVSFQDMNDDGLVDIILITACENTSEGHTGKTYKVGDILFQKKGEFYRDYRLSDKINRFGMNKSIQFIISFVRDGYSTEFLYTAVMQEELEQHDFSVIPGYDSFVSFEKLGKLKILPGYYRMAYYSIFMVYLVNDKGIVVWSFQPMNDYEHLYAPYGVIAQDIDGDGMKDIAICCAYSYDSDGQPVVEKDYSAYYQRTAGFTEDKNIKSTIKYEEEMTVAELLDELRAFWGWKLEK